MVSHALPFGAGCKCKGGALLTLGYGVLTKHIPTLSQASEFQLWHAQAYLQSKGLFVYMTGTYTHLTVKNGQEPNHVCTAWQDKFDTHREWTLGIIKTHVHPSVLIFIKDAATPKEAHDALIKQFNPAGTAL